MRWLVLLVVFMVLITEMEARSRLKKDEEFIRSPGMSNRVRRYDIIIGASPTRIRRMTGEKIRTSGVA